VHAGRPAYAAYAARQTSCPARRSSTTIKHGDSPANFLINQGGYGRSTRAPPGVSYTINKHRHMYAARQTCPARGVTAPPSNAPAAGLLRASKAVAGATPRARCTRCGPVAGKQGGATLRARRRGPGLLGLLRAARRKAARRCGRDAAPVWRHDAAARAYRAACPATALRPCTAGQFHACA
jgi:hypothetical protein